MDAKEIRNLQEAYLSVYYDLDELDESDYMGHTPEASRRWSQATLARTNKPASEYPKRGDKKNEVAKFSRHNSRVSALHHDASRGPGKKSPRGVYGRQGMQMTQSDRDEARGREEYGHAGYDPGYHNPPSGPGGMPKGKKLARQKATGVSAESYDIYDVVLSHLLDEGYADTQEAAEIIMANMTEEWRNEIVEAYGRYGGRRGYFNSVGQADRTGGRYKNLGSPTDPAEIKADQARADAARAKYDEAERKRKEEGGQG